MENKWVRTKSCVGNSFDNTIHDSIIYTKTIKLNKNDILTCLIHNSELDNWETAICLICGESKFYYLTEDYSSSTTARRGLDRKLKTIMHDLGGLIDV